MPKDIPDTTRSYSRPAAPTPELSAGLWRSTPEQRERRARFDSHLRREHMREVCAKLDVLFREYVMDAFASLQLQWRADRARERQMRAVFDAGAPSGVRFSRSSRKRLADVSRRRRRDEAVLDDLEALYVRCSGPAESPVLWLDGANSLLECLGTWSAPERAMWASFVRASPELAFFIEGLSAEQVDAARPVNADVLAFLHELRRPTDERTA